MKRLKQGDEVYLIQNKGFARGPAYTKLSKGERRKYRITYVGSWESHEAEMLTKKKTWSVSRYWIQERDTIPASWLDSPLEDYL